jgi:dipeptidyl aminopeptidase/acylaminoacyl peptidase
MLPEAGSSRPVECQAALCTGKAISSIQWRPQSDEVLFTVTDAHEGQAQSIYRWNVRTGAVQLVTRSAGMLNGGGRYESGGCGVSSGAMVCVVAKADRPPRLERIDLATGERQVLFDPNAALALDIAKTTPSRLLHWTDAKGHEFTGQFFPARHTGDGPSPLFVNYYDCRGFLRGGLGDEWPFASLAENGISALCINQAPYRLDAVKRYGLGLSAVKSVVDLLASKGEIDRARVGMGGLSFGTEATLWTAMKSDLLAAASVTSIGMSRNYYLFGSMRGDVYLKPLKEFWQLGSPEETAERWRLLSPAANLDKIKAPILMQMPEQEYVMALDYAIPLIRDHRADLYVFPNEPHQKFQPRHKLAAYERNIDWFRFWLQGYEDPDPAKRAEYKRWRVMKAAGVGSSP